MTVTVVCRDTAEDNYDRLRLMSFMERAKAAYLEETEQLENKIVLDIQSKVEHLQNQVERQTAHVEDVVDRTSRCFRDPPAPPPPTSPLCLYLSPQFS